MAKIAIAMVLVLVATLGSFFVTNQLVSIPALGIVYLQFTASGLDKTSQDPGSDTSVTDVVIRFTQVEIHAADSTENADTNNADNGGWQTITVSQTIIDFNQQQSTVNGQAPTVSNIIGGASLPAGKYNMIRLFTDHATISLSLDNNSVQRTLMIKSGEQTGIKVPIIPGGFDLPNGGTADVTLTFTFNANEIAANQKNMVPVVRATVT